MVAAVLVLLVAGMGVGFGWQPMPDGSPRYEYLVQVEPEMLETLAEGQTIPIVSDVPPGIGPIARVRVVVGRGELPKRRLVTQLKPATDGSSGGATGSGVVLTQYSEPVGRYATPPAGIPQYGTPASGTAPGTAAGASDPYLQAAPGAPGAWNSADASSAANPLRAAASGPAPSLGPETPWNGGGAVPRVADSTAAGPLRRVGAGLQEAAAPLTDGIDRLGNRVRTAADNLGDRTEQLFDELGRPLRPGGALRGGADPATGATGAFAQGAAADSGTGSAPPWNARDGASQPADAGAVDRNNTAAGGGVNSSAPGGAPGTGFAGDAPGGPVAPALVPGGGMPDYSTGSPYGATGSTGAAGAAATATVADPWANSVDPRLNSGGAGGVANGGAAHWSGVGPLPPGSTGSTAATGTGQGGPVLGDASGSREINAGMLALPGARPLEDVAAVGVGTVGAGGAGGNIFAPGTTGAPALPAATGTGQPSTGSGGLLASEGWAARTGTSTDAGQQAPAAPASDARSKAAVIFAWVLLSGSAAGNIYLFWSYLDVRTKYRALVRKTARAVGSRFSPA